ncbi:MAG: YbaN family protein [Pirellulaceae bacterium]|nr:YbaN family protein [Pirellulaceae bacterium]
MSRASDLASDLASDASRSSAIARDSDQVAQAVASRSLVRGWRKAAYLTLAAGCFGLGAVGAFLPGLPATPFLLLCSYLLLRSSPRLNAALLRSRLFGPILSDWQLHGGVQRHVKIKAVAAVTLAVAGSVWLSGYAAIPSLVAVSLAGVGIAVILRLPTVPKSRAAPP